MENGYELTRYLRVASIFTVIFFSISSSSILVLLSGATAVSCAFWRLFIASLILWFFWLLRGGSSGLAIDRRILIYSVASGMFLALHFLLWMESLFIIPVAVSTTVVVTYPLFSAMIDRFILREEIGFLQVIGLTLGFIGVLLFTHPQVASYNVYGVLLSLCGALAGAIYFGIGRLVRKKTDLVGYTVLAYTSASISLLLYALASKENLLSNPAETYAYFLLLALIPMIGGHTLINYILRYMKTSVATSIALTEPIGASILAYFILDQQMVPSEVVVMMLVLASVALTISQEMKKPDNHLGE